jgi:hypothetical protein
METQMQEEESGTAESMQEPVATGKVTGSDEIDLHADPDSESESLEGITEALEGAPWRVAESLLTLRRQINAAASGRNKDSDGTIGNDDHRRRGFRSSDHNPYISDGRIGVVTAMDVTHDPARGCDASKLAASLRASQDTRIKYIIWNRKIASSSSIGGAAAWAWRPYNGRNPHDHHVHISVRPERSHYDSNASWSFSLS